MEAIAPEILPERLHKPYTLTLQTLQAAGLAPEEQAEALAEALMRVFPEWVADYLTNLTSNPAPAEWHWCYFNNPEPKYRYYEPLVVLPNLESAVAHAIELFARCTLGVTAVTRGQDSIIRVMGKEGLLIAIGPVQFEQANPAMCERAYSAIRNLHLKDEADRVIGKLFSLAGLKGACGEALWMTEGETAPLEINAKAIARLLKKSLDELFDPSLKLSECLELVSRIAGARNWQTLCAQEKEQKGCLPPWAVHPAELTASSFSSIQFYPSFVTALSQYGETLSRRHPEGVEVEFYQTTDPHCLWAVTKGDKRLELGPVPTAEIDPAYLDIAEDLGARDLLPRLAELFCAEQSRTAQILQAFTLDTDIRDHQAELLDNYLVTVIRPAGRARKVITCRDLTAERESIRYEGDRYKTTLEVTPEGVSQIRHEENGSCFSLSDLSEDDITRIALWALPRSEMGRRLRRPSETPSAEPHGVQVYPSRVLNDAWDELSDTWERGSSWTKSTAWVVCAPNGAVSQFSGSRAELTLHLADAYPKERIEYFAVPGKIIAELCLDDAKKRWNVKLSTCPAFPSFLLSGTREECRAYLEKTYPFFNLSIVGEAELRRRERWAKLYRDSY